MEWSDALVDTNDGLQWVYSITYKAILNDAEEKLYPTITPTKRNALIKISQITPIVTEQVFLCFKMSLKACLWKVF